MNFKIHLCRYHLVNFKFIDMCKAKIGVNWIVVVKQQNMKHISESKTHAVFLFATFQQPVNKITLIQQLFTKMLYTFKSFFLCAFER